MDEKRHRNVLNTLLVITVYLSKPFLVLEVTPTFHRITCVLKAEVFINKRPCILLGWL